MGGPLNNPGRAMIHFQNMGVQPPFNGYIDEGDFLQVNIYTTASTTGLNISWRTLMPDGRVSLSQQNLDGVSTSTFTTKLFPLAPGFMVSLSVSNLNGGLADQVCFVAVGIQRGPNTGLAPHTILCQGYVSNLFTIDWPPVYVRGPATGGSGALTLIKTTILTVAAATFEFASIPQTYTDLVLVLDARTSAGAGNAGPSITFNSDTGANYDNLVMYLNSGNANSSVGFGQNAVLCGNVAQADATANYPGISEYIIHNYAGTVFYKAGNSASGLNWGGTAGTSILEASNFIWKSTAAITEITVAAVNGNFIAGSRCSLYGRN
jgi:hypothetical protein